MSVSVSILGCVLVVLLTSNGCARVAATLPSGQARFVGLGDGTVRDNLSGLIWSHDANLPAFNDAWDGTTWKGALAFVSGMNAGEHPNMGHSDWRLPRVEELAYFLSGFSRPSTSTEKLLDLFAGIAPPGEPLATRRTDVAPFTNVAETGYWSGTTVSHTGGEIGLGSYAADARAPVASDAVSEAWVVDTGGAAFPSTRTNPRRVWAVRDEPVKP